VIRVYDDAGKTIEAHEHSGEFKGSAARLAQVCVVKPDDQPKLI
jgi:hypothetical protein